MDQASACCVIPGDSGSGSAFLGGMVLRVQSIGVFFSLMLLGLGSFFPCLPHDIACSSSLFLFCSHDASGVSCLFAFSLFFARSWRIIGHEAGRARSSLHHDISSGDIIGRGIIGGVFCVCLGHGCVMAFSLSRDVSFFLSSLFS
ncbi:hypothetical protein B0J15DRAFT_18513 [Fusarium solani]|uniref:Uncharacterized protein n=1 Tax=Fusarium solani TaxID=169388 RepID=A0A9P9L7B2_FUSSL|nr:uncharacterized protein B0J15DRAFT_18513 [Fusarium solani]KAH7275548.1 hypothetical protein B0J15DRAFT_18513 [Fusarium solani]